jgi:putative ABC transport system permease protein
VIGLGTGLAAARSLGAFLYGVSTTDPVAIAGAVAALGVIATLAGIIPARQAARMDPLVALRRE